MTVRKIGRNKNSNSNKSYIAQRKRQINAESRQQRHKRAIKAMETQMIVPRGTARAERRREWMFAINGDYTNSKRMSFVSYESR